MSLPRHEGEFSAVYRSASEVESLQVGASSARLVATGSLTSGRFGLFRWDMTPQARGAGAHFHKTFSESFYVISGTVTFGDGRRWFEATEGDFLHVPERGIHAFRNDGDEAASMLILFAPGAARERYFEEVADIAGTGRRLSAEEWEELYARHDQYMV